MGKYVIKHKKRNKINKKCEKIKNKYGQNVNGIIKNTINKKEWFLILINITKNRAINFFLGGIYEKQKRILKKSLTINLTCEMAVTALPAQAMSI